MTGFKLGSISLGKSTKKYTRPLDFDNNTTMDFGFVQPLFCQFLLPDSTVKVGAKQLVRLAPMPVPSFARVSLVTKYVFVPWSDVCGYYEAMLAKMPFNGSFVPTTLPYITNADMCHVLLSKIFGSYVTFYKGVEKDGNLDYTILSNKQVASEAIMSLSDEWQDYYQQNDFKDVNTDITTFNFSVGVVPTGCDFIYRWDFGGSHYMACWRFSTIVKHIRSIILGLGYNLALTDDVYVNALPLFAFYKAWFDTYSPSRVKAWTDTDVYGIIHDLSDKYNPSILRDRGPLVSLFNSLASCYYACDDDFVSVHRSSLDNVELSGFPYYNALGTHAETDEFTVNEQPHVDDGNGVSLIALQVVQRLTRFVNKDSVIGQKMSNWVRQHFNANIANSLYKDVYQIKTDILPLQINDVFSTSDTAEVVNDNPQGERLGAYAGKGIGFGQSGCQFKSDKHGYLFCLASIVPNSGFCQGNDTSLYGLDRYTLPSADFDALGYEVTPFGFIAGDNGYVDSSVPKVPYRSGFGYVPRFSGFKFKKNIVNGDMSRRGTIDSMAPYYLDRILQTGDVVWDNSHPGIYRVHRDIKNEVPMSSESWRFPTRYPWLGDFDRLFYNDRVMHGTDYSVDETLQDDNFIVQNLFTMQITDCLKPMSMSYDTFDDETDNSTHDVKPQ